jgi:hypothetical protein
MKVEDKPEILVYGGFGGGGKSRTAAIMASVLINAGYRVYAEPPINHDLIIVDEYDDIKKSMVFQHEPRIYPTELRGNWKDAKPKLPRLLSALLKRI